MSQSNRLATALQAATPAECRHSKEPFDQSFHAIGRRADLSSDARLLHAYLVSVYRSGRDRTQREMADEIGLTRHRVWAGIHELVEAGLVRPIRYGLGRPNGYVLLALAPETAIRPDRTLNPASPETSRAGTFYPQRTTKNPGYTTTVNTGRCYACRGDHPSRACPSYPGAFRR